MDSLRQQCVGALNIRICSGKKTLEYDLAEHNHSVPLLITPVCTHETALRQLSSNPRELPNLLQQKLEQESETLFSEINAITDPEAQRQARFATCYLLCTEEQKGEHAFDLMSQLRENFAKPQGERLPFQIPPHIEQAIGWACGEGSRKAAP